MFVKLYNNTNNKLLTLIVDTGADISLLKISSLCQANPLNSNEIITLSGIGQGTVKSVGSILLDLRVENILITHKFHTVHDDFSIPSDGIIGMDFLKEFNCILDFMQNKDLLILRPRNFQHFAIPIKNTGTDNSILLPARSQVIRKICLNSQHEELLVPNQEIQPGVFIANTIVKGNDAYVKILNTNSCMTAINASKIISENISDYDVYKTSKYSENRKKGNIGKII